MHIPRLPVSDTGEIEPFSVSRTPFSDFLFGFDNSQSIMEDEQETSNLHARRKSRSHIGKLSCCFHPDHRRAGSLFDFSSTSAPTTTAPSPNGKSPSPRTRSKPFRSRTGKHRRYSADFSYDPHSYSLNFEDNGLNELPSEPEDPTRNFSSRLRASPPPRLFGGDTSEPDHDHLRSSSRVPSIAEVMKNLELSSAEMRMGLELPRPPERRSEVSTERTLRCPN